MHTHRRVVEITFRVDTLITKSFAITFNTIAGGNKKFKVKLNLSKYSKLWIFKLTYAACRERVLWNSALLPCCVDIFRCPFVRYTMMRDRKATAWIPSFWWIDNCSYNHRVRSSTRFCWYDRIGDKWKIDFPCVLNSWIEQKKMRMWN